MKKRPANLRVEGDMETSGPALARVEIGLVWGELQATDDLQIVSGDNDPVDALSVGHYFGVKPQAAELALDRILTAGLLCAGDVEACAERDLLLTLFTERGIIRGELAQPFILPDPRRPERLMVLAGMGVPGRFGVPELTVLAQELCWSLGRLQRRHLATVLIGGGRGNLEVEDAVGAWLRGIRRALASSAEDVGRQLRRITFIERDARTLRLLDRALRAAVKKGDPALAMDYFGPSNEQLANARKKARQDALAEVESAFDAPDRVIDERVPVRITVGLERKTYQFAAITQSASIPQRDTPLDPRLVGEANDELATAAAKDQKQCGRFLERLLIPEDIRRLIYTPAPIVLMLDATTARLHWEMVARTDTPGALGVDGPFNSEDFLGTTYGLTRQLRSGFAPTPEPPPPPKRTIKVLIVADPAADAPLKGARAEGEEVAKTFLRYNEGRGQRVQITRLFGPQQARRTTVLKKLMLEDFDVLHFAGHCVYDQDDPSNSGWIFSAKNDERITAHELKRVDRVPKFVFSNACESGITPDRSAAPRAGLAPSFAEAFFARGVANFVCTAWPVGDQAARTFASVLYSHLLGIDPATDFAPMHVAMREARRAVALDPVDRSSSWGAYQHYGNPYFRFFQSADSA